MRHSVSAEPEGRHAARLPSPRAQELCQRRCRGTDELLIAGLVHPTNSLSAKGVAGPVCRGCSITDTRAAKGDGGHCVLLGPPGPRAPQDSRVRQCDALIRPPPPLFSDRPWWSGSTSARRTQPATHTRARDDSIAYLSLMHEDGSARSQRHCLPTDSGLGGRCPLVTRSDSAPCTRTVP